jgi:transcriptional regulator with XRE-family HTH domain
MARMLVVVKIGDRLRDLRVRRALTQEELADKADVGTNTVARLERNETEPHMSTLRKLAKALDIDPAELVGG